MFDDKLCYHKWSVLKDEKIDVFKKSEWMGNSKDEITTKDIIYIIACDKCGALDKTTPPQYKDKEPGK